MLVCMLLVVAEVVALARPAPGVAAGAARSPETDVDGG